MQTEVQQVRQIWQSLGLPGIIDVHTHFMPKSVLDKVWDYFDTKGPMTRRAWPITYRTDEAQRVNTLRRFGVRWFTSLVYAHKPQMADWLNQWAAQFALTTPDCLHTATFYPEPEAAGYVADAFPAAGLAGDGSARQRAEATRWLSFVNSDVHPAFLPLFAPARFIGDESQFDAVKDAARKRLRGLFESAEQSGQRLGRNCRRHRRAQLRRPYSG